MASKHAWNVASVTKEKFYFFLINFIFKTCNVGTEWGGDIILDFKLSDIFQGQHCAWYMIKKICTDLWILCLLTFFYREMKIACEEILFQKDLDICVDKFKRFKLLLLGMKDLKCELAIADTLKPVESVQLWMIP